MRINILESAGDVDREAAVCVSRQLMLKPDSLIGLATGETTLGMYEEMVRQHREFDIDYSQCKACNLDEYVGVKPDDPASCCYRIWESLHSRVNIKPENVYVPDGSRNPPEAELDVFRETVERFGGVDIQVLSIGTNGHIAFNEPGTPFDSVYRLASISENTFRAKAALFGGEEKVPRLGITMGIRDIMMARKILLIAKGKHKAEIIREIVCGRVTEAVPASVVQLHPNVDLLVDHEAASLLGGM